MRRTRGLFDAGWKFYKGDLQIPEWIKMGVIGGLTDNRPRLIKPKDHVAFMVADLVDPTRPSQWRDVTLPHDFVVEGKPVFSKDMTARFHGYLPTGVGFYRKTFFLPKSDRGKKITLEFDGAFRQADVWFNGMHLHHERSGYTGFQVDISDPARYGGTKGNTVLVRCDARVPEGWWYEGGGLYRHVWLKKTHRVHVAQWGTYITTPQIGPASASVKIQTRLQNETRVAAKASLTTEIIDPNGKRVARSNTAVTIKPGDTAAVSQSLKAPKPQLWSLETPRLYKALSTLRLGSQIVDTYETSFGIRSIRFDVNKGFFLNNKHVVIKGTCNHQDFAGVGVALPDSLQEYRIQRLKAMGSNAYRAAHHPPTPELLDACDRLGMLVMDENRRLDSSAQGMAELDSMILRDRNHPSIIIWSMENEEALEGRERGARILDSLVRRCHFLDPTRPATAAINKMYEDGGYADQLDIVGFNYGSNDQDRDLRYRKKHPLRPLIGSETNSSSHTRGVFQKDPQGRWLSFEEGIQWWRDGVEPALGSLLKHPFLTGIFKWTGFDYRGEPVLRTWPPEGWPSLHSHFGAMDQCGFPKAGFHYHRAAWSDEGVIELVPHWNWSTSMKGQPVKVTCISNMEQVELFLNGRSLGVRRPKPAQIVSWDAPYQPGELKAVGWKNGMRHIALVSTTGPAASLRLLPDRKRLKADGRDAMPIAVEVLDKAGRIVPTANMRLRFKVKGAGRLIGVGNGDPARQESDKRDDVTAFNGLAMVILQSNGKKGRISVSVEATGLRGARFRS